MIVPVFCLELHFSANGCLLSEKNKTGRREEDGSGKRTISRDSLNAWLMHSLPYRFSSARLFCLRVVLHQRIPLEGKHMRFRRKTKKIRSILVEEFPRTSLNILECLFHGDVLLEAGSLEPLH